MIRVSMMLGLTILLTSPLSARAQGLGHDELQRQVNRGVVPPYEGASQFERYNYNRYMIPMYGVWDSTRFYDLEYQDRLERQAKFGHRWPSAKYGSDFQVQRIINENEKRTENLDNARARRGWFFGAGAGYYRAR